MIIQDPFQTALNQALMSTGQAFGTGAQNAYNAQQAQQLQQMKWQQAQQLEQQKQSKLDADKQKKQQALQRFGIELSKLGDAANPISIASIYNRAIAAGVDASDLQLQQKIMQPQIKANLDNQAAENFMTNIFGPQGTPSTQNNNIPHTQPQQPGDTVKPTNEVQPQSFNTPQQQQNDIPEPIKQLSDSQLAKMSASGIPRVEKLADSENNRRVEERKEFRDNRNFAYKRAGKYLEEIDSSRKTVADQTESLLGMENAIKEGDLTFFSQDNLASMLGKYGEGLRTTEGAAFLTYLKEFLVSDLGRIGGRPNQWIEQQIKSALGNIGRSKAANLVVVEALRSRIELDKSRIRLTDEEESRQIKDQGFVSGNIAAVVDTQLKSAQEAISNRLAYKLREIKEQEKPTPTRALLTKRVVRGTPLTLNDAVRMDKALGEGKARERAQSLGYRIPDPEEYRMYR